MLKWGLIGLGNMANHFAMSISEVDNSELIAISSSSKKKLDKFGQNFSIKINNRFNNYLDILNSNVDAVYISTLNNNHAALIEFLIKNNKKVLCEKPFVINYQEAENLNQLIKSKDNNFFEAIAYRSHPQTEEIISLINNGTIGDIYKIESTFGFQIKKINPKSRLFNKDVGGGAILDIGCYPVSFAFLFCGKNDEIKINKVNGNICKTGVDNHAELFGSINDKIELDLKVSFQKNFKNSCKIYGSKGDLNIISPWLPEKRTYLEVNLDNSYYKKFIMCNKNVYAQQIDVISDKFLSNETNYKNLVNISQSTKISKILTNWRNMLD